MTEATATRQSQMSQAEWEVRKDLAAAYRLVALYGWEDLVFTHLSARVPGPEHHFLINPYGWLFDEITASSLIKVDSEGEIVDPGATNRVNPAGFTIHSAIHEVRHDANCVMHTHTAAGIAVSTQKEGILPISQQSIFVLSSLAYHDYEGVALNEEEKPRLQADLGRANNLVLRNHGLLTCGKSVADAFLTMYTLQRCCEIQVRAQAQNAELIPIPQAVLDGAAASMKKATNGAGAGIAWPALLRKLDRVNPGYDA